MDYVIIAFRSRTETFGFSKFISARGINNSIVNTPKSAGVGCGISVKTDGYNLSAIRNILMLKPAKTFAGIFSVKIMGGKQFVRRV